MPTNCFKLLVYGIMLLEGDKMKFNIHGRKLEVTEPIKNYIESKIGKLDKYFDKPDEITAKVVLRIRGIEQIVEVTIVTNSIILRGEVSDKDLYAAIDLVSEKIERQIRKNKTKIKKRNTKNNINDFVLDFEEEQNTDEKTIVKRKRIEMKPMNEEEAILQMDLLGHDFFVFKNVVDGKIDILYKRNDENFGIIETD